MLVKYSLGLDVSSKDIKACLVSIDKEQSVKVKSSKTILNTKRVWTSYMNGSIGGVVLLKFLRQFAWKQLEFIMKPALIFFMKKVIRYQYYFLIKPNDICKFGFKSKNDNIDAKGLTRMGAEQKWNLGNHLCLFFERWKRDFSGTNF